MRSLSACLVTFALPILALACSAQAPASEGNGGDTSGGGTSSNGGSDSNGNGSANGGSNGNNGGSSNSNGNTGNGPFSVAAHAPMAQLASNGGPVLAAPKIVAITFDGDTLRSQIEDFAAKIGPSEYWKTVVSEYGVGPATATTAHISQPAPKTINDTAIQQFLQQNIKSGGLLGAPDANAIYVMLYPQGTTVTQGSGQDLGTGCQDFGGYHDEISVGGVKIAYAVIPRCASFPPAPAKPVTGMDFVSVAMSHELAEAATDPHVETEPAFAGTDNDDLVWAMMTGGENGDMCAVIDDYSVKPDELGYVVQRLWSNKAALASHDPCVPAPSQAYFNAAFAPPDSLSVPDPYGNDMLATKGIKLAVGESKSVEIDLYSDSATGDWSVAALHAGDPAVMDLSIDKTSGKGGDKITLTVTLKQALQYGSEPFIIESTMNGVKNDWYGLVGQ